MPTPRLTDDDLRATLAALAAAPAAPRPAPFALGLTGPAGAGKSTVAAAIMAALGNARPLHAGFTLKAMLRGLYVAQGLGDDLIRRKIDGDLKRDPCAFLGGRTPTEAQQTLGTEWGRNLIAPDLWLDAWRREAARRIEAGEGVINDSVRFENEAAAIRALGGIIVRLDGRRDSRVSTGHPSEAGVRPDLAVDNAGSLGETVATILAAIRSRNPKLFP